MIDYKLIIGIIASVLGLAGYIPYFFGIIKGQTKPHVFSWLVWSILEGIAFFAQMSGGAGAGALVAGTSAFFCLIIAILALFKGEKNITRFDWLAFTGALVGLILWRVTDNPLLAVILITITDMLVFAPTFRKSYYKPNEEMATSYLIASIRLALSLFAMDNLNLVTGLYPASLVISNSVFIIMLFFRRRTLTTKESEL